MIFDTDVLIYAQRGVRRAALAIDSATERFISIQSLMELLQGARDKDDLRTMAPQQNLWVPHAGSGRCPIS